MDHRKNNTYLMFFFQRLNPDQELLFPVYVNVCVFILLLREGGEWGAQRAPRNATPRQVFRLGRLLALSSPAQVPREGVLQPAGGACSVEAREEPVEGAGRARPSAARAQGVGGTVPLPPFHILLDSTASIPISLDGRSRSPLAFTLPIFSSSFLLSS